MSNICDFDRILKTKCNLLHFTRNCRINNLDDFEGDEALTYLWTARVLIVKEKGMIICYIMNRCLVMFLRGGKLNVVEYWCNIVAKLKVKKWSLSKQLSNYKLKILMLYQDNYFVVSVKLNFCERLRSIVLMMKVNVNLLQTLTMNSLNVKHQGKSSSQLPFYLSVYTQYLSRAE